MKPLKAYYIFYLQRNLFLMAEAQIFEGLNNRIAQVPVEVQVPVKLPRIDHPRSREAPRSKNEKRKTPPLLPLIKQTTAPPPQEAQTIQESEHQADDFAAEIEERLKMVLENVNQGEQICEDYEEDEDIDFEQLIQQNKEKLKQQKLVKTQAEGKQVKSKSKTLKAKNQNSLYQKRIKEYRDASSENKFIQKRKEVIALRQEAIERERANEKAKTLKTKQENNQNYSSSITKLNIPKGNPRPKYSAKQRKPEEVQPPVIQNVGKTADLFDNIQNFLENPYKIRAASEKRNLSQENMKNLQQKIKQINQKLGVKDNEDSKTNIDKAIQQKTALDWKRLQYNRGSNFKCHYDSNFQKEIDKINSLQQKNSHSLNRFLDYQKALVELTLLKRGKKPQGKTN